MDHLSRQTNRGLVRSEDAFQRLEAMGGVAEIVNPPKQKTSTHVSPASGFSAISIPWSSLRWPRVASCKKLPIVTE
jgi:hypothetical protein